MPSDRRVSMQMMWPVELELLAAAQAVEDVGTDVLLTEAVNHIAAARAAVSDYIDASIKRSEHRDSKVFYHYGLKKFVPFPNGNTRGEWDFIGKNSVERAKDLPDD